MAQIIAAGKTFEVSEGANLREALLGQNLNLYNSGAKILNCHGHATCGTCLVAVEGAVSEPNPLESIRMAFPPNSSQPQRRLSCQVKVLGDVRVTKFDGFFGEGTNVCWTPEKELIRS